MRPRTPMLDALPGERQERWHSMLDGALVLAIAEAFVLALFFGLLR